MADEILEAAGIKHRETRFLKPPAETYAVWLKEQEVRGPDEENLVCVEDYSIELYAAIIDPVAEGKIEFELDARGIPYLKSEHIWIESEQLYQTTYSFEQIKKRR